MARKVSKKLEATLKKNTLVEKGGAWLLNICIQEDGIDSCDLNSNTAWANPSAAKRYLKTVVLENTPRKSIKMTACTTTPPDAKGKPMAFEGTLTYKVDA